MSRPADPGIERGDERVLHAHRELAVTIATHQRDLVDRFLAAQTQAVTHQRLARATWDGWSRDLRLWIHFCDTIALTDTPSPDTVADFIVWAAGSRCTSTVTHLVGSVRAWSSWCATHASMRDIATAVEAPPADPLSPLHAITLPDFTRVVDAIAGADIRAVRDRAMLWILYAMPVETATLRRVQVQHVDFAGCTVRITPRGRRAADVIVPLPRTAATYLASYLALRHGPAAHDPLFTSIKTGRSLSLLSMRLCVRRALDVAGVRPWDGAQHERYYRYPVVPQEQLAHLTDRVAQHPHRQRARALLQVIAVPQARIAWHLVRRDQISGATIRVGGRRPRTVTLPEPVASAIQAYLTAQGDQPPGYPLFPGPAGALCSPTYLRREAWALLTPTSDPRGSVHQEPATSLLRASAIAGIAASDGPGGARQASGMRRSHTIRRTLARITWTHLGPAALSVICCSSWVGSGIGAHP